MGVFSDFWDFLRGLNGQEETVVTGDTLKAYVDQHRLGQLVIYELALQSGVDLIAGALSKCEVRTFLEGREIQGAEYYRWNYEPNCNQNASEFRHRIVNDLIRTGECLVVEDARGQLLVADSYRRRRYAMLPDRFENVTVNAGTDGAYTFSKTFRAEDVLLFRLHNQRLTALLETLNAEYAELLESAATKFRRSAGEHGVLKIDAPALSRTYGNKPDGTPITFQDVQNEIMTKQFSNYFRSPNAVMTLFEGFDYESKGSDTSRKSTSDVKDIADLNAEIYDRVANALLISPQLLRGTVADTEEAETFTISYGIEPIAIALEREINRKKNGQAVLQDTRHMVDTGAIRHQDIWTAAAASDKLRAAALFSTNELRRKVREPRIDEPWADEYVLTKNYETINEEEKTE